MANPRTRRSGKQKWRRRKAARPEEILNAALELFVERGFKATKLDDVARQAGVSKGTLYRYYTNKEALFRAVVIKVILPEVERVEKQVKAFQGSSDVLVRTLIHGWWDMVDQSGLSGIPKLMVAEAGNFPEYARFFMQEVVLRVRRLFAGVVRRGIRRGEFRKCNVHYAARVLVAPMVLAAIMRHSLTPFDEPYDARKYLDLHLDMFLKGLSAGSDGR